MDSGQVESLYNRGARVILELSEELTELIVKFGERSKLVQRKSEQLKTLVELHDETKEEYYRLVNICVLSRTLHNVKDVIIAQHETGLSWDKVAKLYGLKEDWGKAMQFVDDKVNEHHVKLKEILGEDYSSKIDNIIRNGG